jgi:ADP-ribose pyrophosphatase YjhB (NUDIX family)
MPIVKHKVLAYITAGPRLLVFRHPEVPAAGIQVPAGTVEPGERLADAVLREAAEETGLRGLTLVGYLGDQVRDMADCGRAEIHQRHFYHLRYSGTPPDTWRHAERFGSDQPAGPPIVFEFYWVALPAGVPPLIADHDALLPTLCQRLFSDPPSAEV